MKFYSSDANSMEGGRKRLRRSSARDPAQSSVRSGEGCSGGSAGSSSAQRQAAQCRLLPDGAVLQFA